MAAQLLHRDPTLASPPRRAASLQPYCASSWTSSAMMVLGQAEGTQLRLEFGTGISRWGPEESQSKRRTKSEARRWSWLCGHK